MERPPAVEFPIGYGPEVWVALGLGWGAGAVAAVAYAGHMHRTNVLDWWRVAALALAVLAAGAAALRYVHRRVGGLLVWTGDCWQWSVDGAALPVASIDVCLDLQRLLLLRVVHPGGSAWLWLSATSGGQHAAEHWRALRRALGSYRTGAAAGLP